MTTSASLSNPFASRKSMGGSYAPKVNERMRSLFPSPLNSVNRNFIDTGPATHSATFHVTPKNLHTKYHTNGPAIQAFNRPSPQLSIYAPELHQTRPDLASPTNTSGVLSLARGRISALPASTMESFDGRNQKLAGTVRTFFKQALQPTDMEGGMKSRYLTK